MTPIRVAVVGAGHLGTYHAQKIASLSDARLAAIVEPVAEKRQKLAGEMNAPAFDNLAAVRGQVDAAIIAAPTSLHFDLVRQAIDMQLDVLVENVIADLLIDTAEPRIKREFTHP